MPTINGHSIWVETEDLGFEVDITTQPVEKDIDMTDHVQRKARTMSLTGAVVGKDAAKTLTFLRNAQDKGLIVKYVGRNAFTGLLSGLTTSHDYKIADGFNFTLSMTEVRTAKSSYVDKLPAPIKAQAAKIVNSGVKQTKSKGNGKSKGSGKGGSKSGKKGKEKGKEKEEVKKVKFKKGSPWEEK
ncbi:phage baseplate protein [Paenibacillus alvei]|uniref:phage baseplate protein n=1 Tax=Paenibacillus alvei TaxID=44250 RepID=UPI00227F7535|nr:hypothetical protein [Paenibacillus alvei]MCY7484436.1 hypothetical protein [Paenibacillus alvei]